MRWLLSLTSVRSGEGNVHHLPAAYRMIDRQLYFPLSRRVIQLRGEKSLGLEEVRLPGHALFDFNRLRGDAELRQLLNQELLL